MAEVKRLLADSHDVNVNFKDEMDLTPLIYATQRGLAEVVQLLLLKVRSSRFHLLLPWELTCARVTSRTRVRPHRAPTST